MSTAYENLKQHLKSAIRQLKEIKKEKKEFDLEELCTEVINATEQA